MLGEMEWKSERSDQKNYRGVQMEIVDHGTYVNEVQVLVHVIGSSGMNRNNASTHCHVSMLTVLLLSYFSRTLAAIV